MAEKVTDPSSVTQTITVSGKPSTGGSVGSGSPYSYKTYTKTWKNWCPNCHRVGTLTFNPKGVAEGEITCGSGNKTDNYGGGCDSDFDCVTGRCKAGTTGKGSKYRWNFLIDAQNKSNSQGNISASVGESTTVSTDGTATVSDNTTTSTTVSKGYDIEKPFLSFIRVQYSHEVGATAKRHTVELDWTAEAPDIDKSFSGMKPTMINDAVRTNSLNIIDRIREFEGDTEHKNNYYLRQICLCYSTPTKEALYQTDGTDESSNKIILRETGFRSGEELNPITLGFAGKSILSNIQTCLDNTNYFMETHYGKYREQDRLEFKIGTDSSKLTPKYTFAEGNIESITVDGKRKQIENLVPILDVKDIVFTPISNMVNDSIKIFKEKDNPNLDVTTYNYVQHRDRDSVMRYGEMQDVETVSDNISPTEAYYLACKNSKFLSKVDATYTLTLEGVPDIEIGDFANCVFYENFLNDVKQIDSIEIDYNIASIPHVKTLVGMGAMDRIIAGKIQMQNARRNARQQKITVSGGVKYSEAGVNLWEQ